MFGKKKNDNIAVQLPDIKVATIPADFYAGVNPTVKFKEVQKTVELKSSPTEGERKAFEKGTAAGAELLRHPANFLTSRKFIVIGGISLFIIFVGGAAVYYWLQSRQQMEPQKIVNPITVKPPVTTPEIPAEPTTTPETAPTTTPEETPTINEPAIDLPSKFIGESVDFDNDRVSDMAEEIFKTDPANQDSDGDKYPDGHELFYLYNPNGFEPKKIIDSGYVQEYKNPLFGYSLYYPSNWTFGTVDVESRDVLFSTLTGENIEVRVFDLTFGQSFSDWLGVNATDEMLSDYAEFDSRFGLKAQKRSDGMVYFFTNEKQVVALIYHNVGTTPVNYKIIAEIMARSFQFISNTQATIPTTTTEFVPEVLPVIATSTPATTSEMTAGETASTSGQTEEENIDMAI